MRKTDLHFSLNPLFSDAYEWLCLRRCKHPPSSDVWDFRRNWNEIKEFVIEDFTKGTYKLSVQKKLTLSCGDTIAIWSSRDALVIKVLTAIIQEALKPYLSKTCYHLKGHGGLKGAVRDLIKLYPKYSFFCKTDVRSYYDSIDHFILYTKLFDAIWFNMKEPFTLPDKVDMVFTPEFNKWNGKKEIRLRVKDVSW